jgi:hypothetical protein
VENAGNGRKADDSRQLCGIYVRSCYLGNSIRGYECHHRVRCFSQLYVSPYFLSMMLSMGIPRGGLFGRALLFINPHAQDAPLN